MQGHYVKLATKASLKGVVAVAFVAATIAGVLSQRPSHAAGDPLPEALIRNRTPADAVPAAAASVLERIGFDVSNSRQVEGDVYLVTRHRGLCVVSVIGSELPFGCARPGAFFKGHRLFFTIDEDGRPSAPSRLHVAGVARGDVASVRLHFGALVRTVDVTSDGGFSYTADPEALDAGEPTLLEALDRSGHALETSPGPPY